MDEIVSLSDPTACKDDFLLFARTVYVLSALLLGSSKIRQCLAAARRQRGGANHGDEAENTRNCQFYCLYHVDIGELQI